MFCGATGVSRTSNSVISATCRALVRYLPGHIEAGSHLVFYAGRFTDQIANADLPYGCEVVGKGRNPSQWAAVMKEAAALVILDPRSFPAEVMDDDSWDVPLIVVFPEELDAGSLVAEFGDSIFEHVGFFDRVVTPDSGIWRDLRSRYLWAESQRIETGVVDLEKLIADLCSLREWSGLESQNLRSSKAAYRTRARALDQRIAVAKENHSDSAPLAILGVCDAIWTTPLDLSDSRFRGIGIRDDTVKHSRREFPELRFEEPGKNLRFPYEDRSFDLVFGVDAFQNESSPVREALISEMWRVVRPGGHLLFVEDFVFESAAEREASISVSRFMELTLEATAYGVVLDHMESLRYPGEDLVRGAVISLLRLGAI